MSTMNTYSFKQIVKQSKGTFDRNASMEALDKLENYEASIHAIDVDLPELEFKLKDEYKNPESRGTQTLSDYEVEFDSTNRLQLGRKALSDVFQKSSKGIALTDFIKFHNLHHPDSPLSVGEYFLKEAALNTRSEEGHTVLVQNSVARAFVSRNYPTVAKTEFELNGVIRAILDILNQGEEAFRPPVDGVEFREPLFESRFNEENGDVHARIVYDFVTDVGKIMNIPQNEPFGFGLSLSSNLIGSGKLFISSFSLNVACHNGQMSTSNLGAISVNQTSLQNMLKPKHGQGILDLLEKTYGYATDPLELAIMTRLTEISRGKGVTSLLNGKAETREKLYHMLGVSILRYADHRRLIDMNNIRAAAQKGVENVLAELETLESHKVISRRDTTSLLTIIEEDDTIPKKVLETQYGLSAAISRYANVYADQNTELYNSIQELSRKVLLTLPSENYKLKKEQRLY
jgi:hypothetical protein